MPGDCFICMKLRVALQVERFQTICTTRYLYLYICKVVIAYNDIRYFIQYFKEYFLLNMSLKYFQNKFYCKTYMGK